MVIPLLVAGWIQIESPRFDLRTDLPESNASALLEQLERSVIDVGEVPQLAAMKAHARMALTVFASEREYRDVIGNDLITARYSLYGEGPVRVYALASAVSARLSQLGVLLTMAALEDIVDSPPYWLKRGLSAYISTARREGEQWVLGERPAFGTVTGEIPDYAALVSADDTLKMMPAVSADVEVCAWTLVHLLLNGSKVLPLDAERLATWYAAMRNGDEPTVALEKAYDPKLLANAYAARFQDNQLTVVRVSAKARATPSRAVAVPEAIKYNPRDGKLSAPLQDDPRTRAEGLVRAAYALEEGARADLLKQAMAAAPQDYAIVAAALKEAILTDGGCPAAQPLASKLLATPSARQRLLARNTVLTCKQENKLPALRISGVDIPRLVEGRRIPPVPQHLMPTLRRKAKGVIILQIMVGKNGAVDDAKVVRSTLEELDEVVLTHVKSWRFEAGKRRKQFLQPFTFNFN